jgi:hypothetical protein
MNDLERRVQQLEADIRLLKEQVQWLDRSLKDAQLYINELLKRAGIKGGFPE